jgi:hypothetical protein
MIPGLNKYSAENALPQTTEVSAERQLAIGRYIQQFQGILLDADDKCYGENVTESEIAEAKSFLGEQLKKLTAEIDSLDESDRYLANHLCNYAHYYCLTALDDAVENFRSPTAAEFLNQKIRKNPLFSSEARDNNRA